MAEFEVKIVKIDSVEKHPDADRLSIVKIGGYNCISAKLDDGSDRYKPGDLVAYIPEASILPEWMLKKMGFWKDADNKGTLSGNAGNRVKAIKLRGIVSQGVLYPVTNGCLVESPHPDNPELWGGINVTEGTEVGKWLGITKYDPPVPTHMQGEVASDAQHVLKYDIENMQKYDRILVEGEEVVVTEKLHGTLCCLAYIPGLNHPELLDGDFFASSKGMLGKGLFLKNNEANEHNLYHRFLKSRNLKDNEPMQAVLIKISKYVDGKPIYVFGEIFGTGIQDLTYGIPKPEYRVFDIYVGKPGEGRYLNHGELEYVLHEVANLNRVPVLYVGAYSMAKMIELRDGKTYLDTAPAETRLTHIREGIVVTPTVHRENPWTSRTQYKFVSPDYLLRKGNTTEFN